MLIEQWSLPVLLAAAYGVTRLAPCGFGSRAFAFARIAALVAIFAAWCVVAPSVAVNGGRALGWALVVVTLPTAGLAGLVGLEVLRLRARVLRS